MTLRGTVLFFAVGAFAGVNAAFFKAGGLKFIDVMSWQTPPWSCPSSAPRWWPRT
jgi:hypothetical protein